MNLNPAQVVRNQWRRMQRARRRRLTPHGLVLMYHRIAPHSPLDHLGLAISPECFSQHLEVLSRVADVVPLGELERRHQAGREQRPAVALTFDDGYADNLHYAQPLLDRFDAPATVFVATSLIGRPEPFWWDLLAAIVLGNHALPRELAVKIGAAEFRYDKERGDRHALFDALRSRLKAASHADREAAINVLKTWVGTPPPLDPAARPMTRNELTQLHASRIVEIGAHTLKHPSLPSLTVAEQFQEIAGSRRECDELLGMTPTSFAYPYGEFAAETPALVAKAGFTRAYSTQPELNFVGDNAMLIPRFGVGRWDGEAFERHLRREWLP
jgi:peptidoglycan/xylan/chitin deacetylase (PgdA/CDA1 family)